jgi:hypothetical protein
MQPTITIFDFEIDVEKQGVVARNCSKSWNCVLYRYIEGCLCVCVHVLWVLWVEKSGISSSGVQMKGT